MMPSNHLILCHPLLLHSIYPSSRVFFSESVFCIRWLKYWSFNFSISPSNEYSGLIFFRIDWFDLLAVQGTLKTCCSRDWLFPWTVFSSTTVWKYPVFDTQPSLWSSSHIWTWLLEKPLLCRETIFLSEFCISVCSQSPKIKGREETFKKHFSISTILWCLPLSGTLCEDKEKGWTKGETEHNQSGRTGKAREGGSVAVRGRAPIPGMKTLVWPIPEAPKQVRQWGLGEIKNKLWDGEKSLKSNWDSKKVQLGISLAVQWLRLHLPMQRVQIWSLVGS